MSNNLNLSQVAENQAQKEVTINDQAAELDAAFTQSATIDFVSSSKILVEAEFTRYVVFVSSNLTIPRSLTLFLSARFFFVDNTAGSDTLSVIQGTTSLALSAGQIASFYCSGDANHLVKVSENLLTGHLYYKEPVRAATTADGTLATAYENGDTIDGVALATGDRILLKDQTAGDENGIYTVEASGAPTRATDFDEDLDVISGVAMMVAEGTANGSLLHVLTTVDPIVVGTTALVFGTIGLGAFTDLTDTPANLTGAGGQNVQVNAGETALEFVDMPFDIGSFSAGVPVSSAPLLRFVFTRAVTFPSALTGSQGLALTAATAQTDVDVQKNGASVGTIRWAAAGTVATFIAASPIVMAAGDELRLIAPGTPDATLADLFYTLVGVR